MIKNQEKFASISHDIWKTELIYHYFVSSDAFSVFDQNDDGVIDFAEFLFMLACDSKSDLAKKYGDMFQM